MCGQIEAVLGEMSPCRIDADDPFVINVSYSAAFPDDYLRPEIRLEIGPLAAWLPHEDHVIHSYAAETFPDVFQQLDCQVKVIGAELTFWEKVTILHQEAHRPAGNIQPSRYSRHYYDLASMAQTSIKENAFSNAELLPRVGCSWGRLPCNGQHDLWR